MMRKISICVFWKEGRLVHSRMVDTMDEAEKLAKEKNGTIETWPTITSGTIKIYGVK